MFAQKRGLIETVFFGVFFEHTHIRFGEKLVRMECIAIFLAEVCFVCSKEASHRDVSFGHTDYTLWRKISAYWSCIAIFPAEVCFVCLKGSHRDISFEHTDNAFWWKIMKSYRP